jgi:magnesium-protoporphyrin IX monomethyl ester (oxidative) cyclase
MKVLLINPPQTFYPGSDLPAGNLPLGLLYIGAVLEKAGHNVEVLNAFMTDSVFTKNGDSTEVGMSYGKIKQEVKARKPDIVGITNPFTSQVDHAIRVANAVKEVDPNILTVVGGPHASVIPVDFLNDAVNVDVAVIGEGEYVMPDIADYVEGKKGIEQIQGIAYRKQGKVFLNNPRPPIENLDELPFPAYHLVDMELYLNPKKIDYRSFKERAIPMVTSRGCPYNCHFCAVHLHMGKKFRANSVAYVMKHIEFVIEKFKVKNIFFEDDNMALDGKRFEAIVDGMIEKGFHVNWELPNGIRADTMNFEILSKMKKAGCRSVFFGVESGDQEILDHLIDKSLNLQAVVSVAKMCKTLGLKTGGFYAIGFPGEKKENMMKTVEFALSLKQVYDVGMHLFVATPNYGTKVYDVCKEKGYLEHELTPRAFSEVRQPRGVPLIRTEDFTPLEVKEIASKAVEKYKKLSLISYAKYPLKTLKTAQTSPRVIRRFIENLSRTSFTW